jgi:hypothetical protein
MEYISEPARSTPVLASAAVVVVGSGPSGMLAALASARTGAQTMLVERYGQIGGYFSNRPGGGFGLAFHDAAGEQIIRGIPWELTERVLAAGGGVPPIEMTNRSDFGWPPKTAYGKSRPILDFETVKTVALEMLQEARVTPLLHAYGVGAVVEDGAVRGVIVESKSGRQAVLAKVVVDATGDADIAAHAGVPFEKAPGDVLYQVQRCYRLGNVDTDRIREQIKQNLQSFTDVSYPSDEMSIPPGFQPPITAAVVPEGSRRITSDDGTSYFISRSNVTAGRSTERRGMSVGVRRGTGVVIAAAEADGTNVEDLTRAELDIRKQIVEGVRWLRENVPGYEHCYLMGMGEAEQLGVRETRRIVGLYTLSEEDITEGRKFEDSIGRSANSIDMHLRGGDVDVRGVRGWHDIPYRSLVPQGIDNILAAGRCISATHVAEAATRKVPVCMVTGQAAGAAAALAAHEGRSPRELDVGALQDQLRALGN